MLTRFRLLAICSLFKAYVHVYVWGPPSLEQKTCTFSSFPKPDATYTCTSTLNRGC